MQRVNYISDAESTSESDMVLQVDGTGAEPFKLKGLMCNDPFPINELEKIVG